MPRKTPKACRSRGCRHTTTDRDGYCSEHKSSGWERYTKGKTAEQRGYGPEWRRLRNIVIKRDRGLCQPCRREGVFRPGSSVDHIIAKAHGGTDDPNNLECICTEHHRAKTAKERLNGGRGNAT